MRPRSPARRLPAMLGPRARHPVVVVVDDHAHTRDMLREALELAGMDVRACSNVGDALGAVLERAPDIVVTDLRLAGGPGGAHLAALLRADPATSRIAVLAISGALEATPEVVRSVDAYLSRPIDLATLPDLVSALAETRARAEPSRRDTATIARPRHPR